MEGGGIDARGSMKNRVAAGRREILTLPAR
jgi:hypothetical protein